MVQLSERQLLLLQLLSEAEGPLLSQELTGLLGVSARTVRYEVSRVNRTSGGRVIESGAHGYQLNRSIYRELLGSALPARASLNDDDRVLLYLLDQPATNVYDLARDCYVGETAVRATLQRISKRPELLDVSLSVRSTAVQLHANEFEIRTILGRLVRRTMDTSGGRHDQLHPYLPSIDLEQLEYQLKQVLSTHSIQLDDIRLENLLITVAIFIERAGKSRSMFTFHKVTKSPYRYAMQDLAKRLVLSYPERLLTSNDIDYITSVLNSYAEVPENDHGDDLQYPGLDILDGVLNSAIEETIEHFRLTVDKERLRSSLSGHLRRMMKTSDQLIYFRNGLQESLRSRSPFLFDIAAFFADKISQSMRVLFTDDEIGLLTIYFGLAIRRSLSSNPRITCVVVCPRYQTLRDWLLTALIERHDNDLYIVDVVATSQEADSIPCDLIISTLDEPYPGRESVRVGPLLADLDSSLIEIAINNIRRTKARHRTSAIISRFFDSRLFFVDMDFHDYRDVISFLASVMESLGTVPHEFLESVLRREAYSPTAFARRFAVPHAMDFLATETKVAVLLPKSPIKWGDSSVIMVFMIAINRKDYDDFTSFYQSLVHLLHDPQKFSALQTTKTFQEFTNSLRKNLTLD